VKIPKTVIIVGETWQVKVDKSGRGGCFDTDKSSITVGTKDLGEEEIAQEFLHECLESILANRSCRYKLPYTGTDNGNYIFVFNHEQMAQAVVDLYLAIRDSLKNGKG